MINVYAYATNSYLKLANKILLPSFRECHDGLVINMITGEEKSKEDLAGRTNNHEFKGVMMRRLLEYLRILKIHKGERVLFMDADIVFFRPFVSDLCSRLEEKDLLHQGGGFLAFNSNEKTINFLQELCDYCQSKPKDELVDGFPEFELVEFLFDADRSEWIEELPEKYGFMTEESYFYHAMNGGSSMLEKLYTLNLAQNIDNSLRGTSSFENRDSYKKFKLNKRKGIVCYGFEFKEGSTCTSYGMAVYDHQNFYTTSPLSGLNKMLSKYDDVFVSLGFSWEKERVFLWSVNDQRLYAAKGSPKLGEDMFFGEYHDEE